MTQVKTIAQRDEAFIVQLDGDAILGVARIYDSALGRLYPPRPLDEVTRAERRSILLAPTVETRIEEAWTEPRRQVTQEEILVAARPESAVPHASVAVAL